MVLAFHFPVYQSKKHTDFSLDTTPHNDCDLDDIEINLLRIKPISSFTALYGRAQ